jgi:hypothetical protein
VLPSGPYTGTSMVKFTPGAHFRGRSPGGRGLFSPLRTLAGISLMHNRLAGGRFMHYRFMYLGFVSMKIARVMGRVP